MSEDNNNTNNNEYEKVCYMCRRTEKKAGPMIDLPGGISICHHCLQQSFDTAIQFTGGDLQNLMDPSYLKGMGFPAGGNGMFFGNAVEDEEFSEEDPAETAENAPEIQEEGAEASSETPEEGKEEDTEEAPEKTKKPGRRRPMGNRPFGGFSMMVSPEELQSLLSSAPHPRSVKKNKEAPKIDLKKIPVPHKICEMLSEYVVGQETAKKTISVGVYNHYKRLANTDPEVEIEKSNMLMIGPTGSGKTFLVKTLAKLLDVPLAIADATALTEAGYIGDDIESVVTKLLTAADNDVERAEQGIIFIDEIDKLARKRNTTQRDVNGEAVQQGLLKLLEGAEIEVPVGANSKNGMVPLETVNTSNILFICGGAFPDLEDIIKERLTERSSMGFNSELRDRFDQEKNILKYVETEDVRKFGMIPEFIGRLPIIFTLSPMDKDMLIRVLKEPKNAIIRQYQKLLSMDEVELCFSEDAFDAIAEKALKKDTGARALRSIIEEFMLDIMFEIPKDPNIGRVTVTKAYIEGTGGPLIEMRGASHYIAGGN